MIYLMMGGPATGKGTRSAILSSELNIPHISTGDLLRKESETNEKIKEELSQGKLIADEFITELLYNRLTKEDCKAGFIIDGYPRTLNQTKLLDELLEKLNMKITNVVELDMDDEIAYKRILGRKICVGCEKVYGVDFPSKIEDKCDVCGGKLVIRSDDTKETLAKRIETYKQNAKPILEFYKNKGILLTLDAAGKAENILSIL